MKEAMKLALDELKHIKQKSLSELGISLVDEKVLAALEEALVKQEQGEPVGEMQLSAIYEGMVVPVVPVELPAGTKLYTKSPQQRKPLTQQEVIDGFCKLPHDVQYVSVFNAGVRFAEAEHGVEE